MRVGRCGGGEAVGETQNRPFQLSFNSSLKVDFQGSRVTSDGGLVLVRELDERLGLSELINRHLSDCRRGKNIQLPLAALLRQSIYSRLAGYEDVNDAARLSQDPTFRLIGSRRIRGSVNLASPIIRDGRADTGGQPCRSGRTQSGVSREGRSYRFAAAKRAGYGQHRSPSPRSAGTERLQRPLRVHLLSSVVAVQPRGRLPGRQVAARQRPQRGQL